ncbi:TetR/AcrR family transcriptional regulator [Specibacter sp. RAF43]|uniref:TetR/AcrR family transcriptional regulator n=1 Tax=Specibacter sp. RAF43 TaxID=3233057 RepID=UPI003F962703
MMPDTEPGLRARKRTATRAAIQKAAVSLALEHGYESVTVEMICEASLVSQRTFFNYFGSKEGVILGGALPAPSAADLQRFVEHPGPNILADLLNLVASVITANEPNLEVFELRRRVIHASPELIKRQKNRIGELEGQFRQYVLDRFTAQGRDAGSPPNREDEAAMVVALAAGAMHFVMAKWVGGNFSTTLDELAEQAGGLIAHITTDSRLAAPPVPRAQIRKQAHD